MLESLLTQTAEEKDREIRQAFSRVCSKDDGMLMLVTILHKLCYFLPTDTTDGRAYNQVAKEIIGLCTTEVAARVYASWKNAISEKQESEKKE